MPTNKKSTIWLKSLARCLIIIGLLVLIFRTSSIIRVFGYSGLYALEFDGETDYVDLPAASDIIGESWQFRKSVTLWVRPSGPAPSVADPFNGDLIFGDFPRWGGMYQANINTQDRIWILNEDNSGGGTDRIGIEYTPGEWTHIAFTHGENTLRAYKNGIEIGYTESYSTARSHPGVIGGIIFRFGGGEGAGGGGFDTTFAGQIDEVRIYSRTLTVEEIRQDMYRTLVPGTDYTLGAWYQMSNGTGTTVTDDSGNGNTGIMRDGGIIIEPDGDYAQWIESGSLAGPRNALDFDGTDDYASVPAAINMPAELTLEAWIYPRDTSQEQKWIVGENGGAQLTMDGTNVRFIIHDGSTFQGPATGTIAANQWQHVAGIFDGASLRIFVDGIDGTPFSFSGSNQDRDGIFSIGALDNFVKANDIIVDEVRLWDHDRSVDDLRQDMVTSMEGTEPGLLAYYRFDQVADAAGSTTLYDITEHGNDGTLMNMDLSKDWVASSAFHTWIGTDSIGWTDNGNWSTYAVPGTGDHVGIFNNTNTSNTSVISSTVTLDNLVVGPNTELDVTSSGSLTVDESLFNYGMLTSDSSLTVGGSLFNYGTLIQSRSVSGSSDIPFFDTAGYGGVLINPNGQDLGNTTVQIAGGMNCLEFEETVQRCFEISPTNLPASGTTLTFFFDSSDLGFLNCGTLNVYHDKNGAWELMTLDTTYDDDGRMCGSDPQSVRITGVTDYSSFIILDQEPTAITIDNFTANPVSEFIFPLFALFGLTGLAIVFIIKNSPN